MSLIHTIKALPIKFKLMLIMMTTSGIAIIMMALLVVANQAINNQRAIQQQLITLADVLGSRSTGALTFDDVPTGEEILNALAAKSNVIYALIERSNGQPFATFGNHALTTGAVAINSHPVTDHSTPLWTKILSNEIHVARDIYLENERIGKIHIVSNLEDLNADLFKYMLLVTTISGICFVITLLVCSRLQKLVADPIVNLQKAMDTVSKNKDYSLRVENSEENELGALVEGFNHMLQQIQLRDTKLAEYSTHLEKTVATRSLQLTDANEKRILWLETMARFLRHELKNSSVGIKTSLDLIERRSIEKHTVEVYLARARKSMASMNALLQSAGDASNLEAIIYKEARNELDLSATVTAHMETYASIYPDMLINLDCQSGIFVVGNEIRLNQLLDKLISNAIEHADAQSAIKVSVKQRQGNAQLMVKNQGDALPKDKLTMFDLFVSLRTPERKTDENFGLGLYIVKLIAESHSGQVVAYDLSDEKSVVFEVTLPIANYV